MTIRFLGVAFLFAAVMTDLFGQQPRTGPDGGVMRLQQTSFSGGDGTADNPYQISSQADLDRLNDATVDNQTAGRYYVLTKDLTDQPYTRIIGTGDGVFQGHFDGQGHTVRVEIDLPKDNYVGLFSYVGGGTVSHLRVSGTVVGSAYVGGIVGCAEQSVLVGLVADCDVTGSTYTGGVFGAVGEACHIARSANYGTVSGGFMTGGVGGAIISHQKGCVVDRCANYGEILGDKEATGGVLGYSGQGKGNNIRCIANYGRISGERSVAGLIGNPLWNDTISYCISFGTGSTNQVGGALGNANAENVKEFYYDWQYLNSQAAYPNRMKSTAQLVGHAMESQDAESGFTADDWLFADGLLPRPLMDGEEKSERALLYATPILLSSDNSLDHITDGFMVGTANGVEWTSQRGRVVFEGVEARPVSVGADVLTARLGTYTRDFYVEVADVSSGIGTVSAGAPMVQGGVGCVVLGLPQKSQVDIYGADGTLDVRRVLPAGIHSLRVGQGIRLVHAGDKVYKVLVR